MTAVVAVLVAIISLPRSMGRLARAAELCVCGFCFLVFTLVYYGSVELSCNHGDCRTGTNGSGGHTNISNTSKGANTSGSGTAAGGGSSLAFWPPPNVPGGEWNALGSILPVILFAYGCQVRAKSGDKSYSSVLSIARCSRCVRVSCGVSGGGVWSTGVRWGLRLVSLPSVLSLLPTQGHRGT